MFKILHVSISLIAALFFSGCSFLWFDITPRNSGHPNSYIEKKQTKTAEELAPKSFAIRIAIEEGKITYAKVLNGIEDTIGRVRAEGMYFYLDTPVMRLEATKYPQYYWIAKLPVKDKGTYILKAYRRKEPLNSEMINPKIPLMFKLVVVVKDFKIIDHFIEDGSPTWGYFKFYKLDKKRRRLLFVNEKFPGSLWATKYTTNDGRYLLTVKLINEKE